MDLSNENMIHTTKDGIQYLQFRKLLEYKNIINCYTLSVNNVDFKTNFLDETDILKQSYSKICNALDIKREDIVRPEQSHTDCIEIVNDTSTIYKDVDGLITNKYNINLMLTYADCTPILLYDTVNNVIANIHSGWKGTVQRIGEKAVKKMVKEFNSKPENIIACLGPCIGKCHFEVDDDVKNIFVEKFSYFNKNYDIIEEKNIDNTKKYNIDTTLINRLMLENCGLKPENIIESKICTVCNSSMMHSYRAEKDKAGRNVAIMGLRS